MSDSPPTTERTGYMLAKRYRVGRALGEGLVGSAFEAVDTHADGPVAVKMLWPRLAQRPDTVEALQRAVRKAQQLTHPNIAGVYDFSECESGWLLTSELVRGETIDRHLEQHAANAAVACELLRQVCSAVGAAHAAGVVHGHLRTSNVLIDRSGSAAVTDFGLAHAIVDDDTRQALRSLSPEQWRGEQPTARSDLYALASLVTQLFEAIGPIPGGLQDAVERCLAIKPSHRPESVKPLERALNGIAARPLGERSGSMDTTANWSGKLLGERYQVHSAIESGGMGIVYRGTDEQSGDNVAIKVLLRESEHTEARLAREAQALAEMSHPAVVRYIAHGRTADGRVYLVMNWVDGVTLADALSLQPPTQEQAVTMVATVAEAVGEAHRKGVIHRDLKPHNIMLADDDYGRPRVLDFGLAHRKDTDMALTQRGALLGTPAYMAPEQVMGEDDVDARADVYALGCTLFECLTGQPPFLGDDTLAVFAKTLLAPAPRLDVLRDNSSPALADLVASMLHKDRDRRPTDGHQVARLLRDLLEAGLAGERAPETAAQRLTAKEREVQSIMLLKPTRDALPTATDLAEQLKLHFGGAHKRLSDGTVILSWRAEDTATDHAGKVARCALMARLKQPGASMAVATGHAGLDGEGFPVGSVIDAAATLLKHAEPATIRVDDVTAGLLAARFQLEPRGAGYQLHGELGTRDEPQPLMGQVMPFRGRDTELNMLDAVTEGCFREAEAQVVLITGPAGIGKSRLRREFLRQLRQHSPDVTVLTGSGDDGRAGSPYGLLRDAIRVAGHILDGEPQSVQQDKLLALLGSYLQSDEARSTARFLGEMIGVPFSQHEDIQLAAAREDPAFMADQIGQAVQTFMDAACNNSPLVLVLEDLHWGDVASIRQVDEALRRLAQRPLLVLAFSRPDVHERFVSLWPKRDMITVELRPLRQRVSEALVVAALEGVTSQGVITRIAGQSGGNPFFLEELARAHQSGTYGTPTSVLAMVQSRLGAMEADARRVLRAASVFGQTFWQRGVEKLVGRGLQGGNVRDWLDTLVERDVLAVQSESRIADERQLSFRHALLRDAAYAMLTDSDRSFAHRGAGEWLERAGVHDPRMLAEHFQRGEAVEAASKWWQRAAERALAAGALDDTIESAQHALAAGVSTADRARLQLMLAEAHNWRAQHELAAQAAANALAVFDVSSDAWYEAAHLIAEAEHAMGNADAVATVAEQLLAIRGTAAQAPHLAVARATVMFYLWRQGREELAAAIEEAERNQPIEVPETQPRRRAMLHRARGLMAIAQGDVALAIHEHDRAQHYFRVVGDLRWAGRELSNVGYSLALVGDYAAAEARLDEALQIGEQLDISYLVAVVEQNLGFVLSCLQKHPRARQLEEKSARAFERFASPTLEGISRAHLAYVALQMNDIATAKREAARAMALVEKTSSKTTPFAAAALARAHLAAGEPKAALRFTRMAVAHMSAERTPDEREALIRLTHAEALLATNDRVAARDTIELAWARLHERASKISDERMRRMYLTQVDENACTIALARELGIWDE